MTEETTNAELEEIQNAEPEEMQNAECETQCDEGENEVMPDKVAIASPTQSNRSHLTTSVPRAAKLTHGVMSKADLAEMRAILGDVDDTEIQRLYKKVTK